MDSTFNAGSNYTIVDSVRLRRPRYHRYVPFNFLLSLAAPHLHGVLVLVTGNKFIAGVVDTSKQLIAGVVDTSDKHSFPNISANFREKIWNGPNGILGGPGDNDLWKKTWSRKSRVRLPVMLPWAFVSQHTSYVPNKVLLKSYKTSNLEKDDAALPRKAAHRTTLLSSGRSAKSSCVDSSRKSYRS